MAAHLLRNAILTMLVTVSTALNASLETLIPEEVIEEKIQEVSKQLDQEYQGKDLVIVMVMKGAVCLGADLLRSLTIPATLEYIKASSYGQGGTKQGELSIAGIDSLDITSKDVLLIDDIYDTGVTMERLALRLQEKNPRSLKTLVLLSKKKERKTDYVPDHTLFEIDDLFVVGYGLDYKEHYRGLKGIYVLNPE